MIPKQNVAKNCAKFPYNVPKDNIRRFLPAKNTIRPMKLPKRFGVTNPVAIPDNNEAFIFEKGDFWSKLRTMTNHLKSSNPQLNTTRIIAYNKYE